MFICDIAGECSVTLTVAINENWHKDDLFKFNKSNEICQINNDTAFHDFMD